PLLYPLTPLSTLFPYTTLFRSATTQRCSAGSHVCTALLYSSGTPNDGWPDDPVSMSTGRRQALRWATADSRTNRSSTSTPRPGRSEEHTSELQSRSDIVCRLLL